MSEKFVVEKAEDIKTGFETIDGEVVGLGKRIDDLDAKGAASENIT